MDTIDELPATAESELVLGRYRLGRRLGAGGFGTVYAATDERLRRPVAVKVIPSSPARADRERAQREALAAGRLDHPGVVAVFDAGEDGRARYLVSELVHGRTLDALSAEGALSDRDVLRIGLALAGALEHAHGRGVVHRDVKPQNVIVPDAPRSAAGVAKLADFGVAHLAGDEPLTRTGDIVGTLAYMAPEQAAGRRVDDRTDLYSLALVLYEALAGVHPVRGGSPAATARRVGTVLPALRRVRRDLPPEFAAAIDRALRPKPDERGALDDLAAALAAALPQVSDDGGTVAAHPLERTEAMALPRGSARAGAALLAAGLAALAVHAAGLPAPTGHGAALLHHAAGPSGATATGAAHATGAALLAAPAAPFVAALAALLAVAALPRAAWAAGALAAAALLAGDHPAAAVLVLAAAAVVPPLLPRRGTAWSVPALAPLLGMASVAVAYPVLAGRARGAAARAALGALGAWWLALAEPLLHRRLLTGAPRALPAGAQRTAEHVLAPLATGGAPAYAAVWALAALTLPWLVRGRWLVTDAVAASAWAAALGAGTAAVAQSLHVPAPAGLVPATVASGALALVLPRIRRGPTVEP